MTQTALLRYLKRLGRTADKIAAKLAEMGIKGNRCGGGSCPIAQYIAIKYPDCSIGVSETSVAINDGKRSVCVELPEAHCDFVKLFDKHEKWPELVVAQTEAAS